MRVLEAVYDKEGETSGQQNVTASKGPVVKPGDLSYTPGTHTVEANN